MNFVKEQQFVSTGTFRFEISIFFTIEYAVAFSFLNVSDNVTQNPTSAGTYLVKQLILDYDSGGHGNQA